MSRSKPNARAKSPVKHYFNWAGAKGSLSFYDKEKGDNVFFPKMKFVVLDELHTVGGWSDAADSYIRGSEVRDLEDPITVWVGKKKHSTNLYSELKNSITGLRYSKAVYIGVFRKDAPMELAKINFTGASFGAWLNFLSGEKDYEGEGAVDQWEVGIEIVGKSKQKKKGSNTYYEPKFKSFELTEEEAAEAIELDKILQEFLDSKTGKKVKTETAIPEEAEEEFTEEEEEAEEAEDVDDLPF